jgi:hypothetical protein
LAVIARNPAGAEAALVRGNSANVDRRNLARFSGVISQNRTIPANLCLFLRWVEFSGVGEDFDEAAGKASELAA